MGADLICFILVGPDKLSTDKELIKRATAHGSKVLRLARSIANTDTLLPAGEKKFQRLCAEIEDLTDGALDIDEPCSADSLLRLKAKDVVRDLIKVWNGDVRVRDATWRPMPNGDSKIFVAGDNSWGDEPDGFGYQTFKHAEQLGLLKFFGVG